MYTENKIPPIISFMYNQCTLKINWCTLKINKSIKYLHIYQCTLKMNFNQLPSLCMIGRKKMSVSVHNDFQKLVFTEKKQCTLKKGVY